MLSHVVWGRLPWKSEMSTPLSRCALATLAGTRPAAAAAAAAQTIARRHLHTVCLYIPQLSRKPGRAITTPQRTTQRTTAVEGSHLESAGNGRDRRHFPPQRTCSVSAP